jgi:hypothetical protein
MFWWDVLRLKFGSRLTRMNAATSLGKSKDSRAIKPLLGALKHEDSLVRSYAAEALGEIGEPSTAEPLRAALADPDEHARLSIARSWIKTQGFKDVRPLEKLLSHNIDEVRAAAAEALGELGDSKAIQPLISRLKDMRRVAFYSVRALRSLGWKPDGQVQGRLYACGFYQLFHVYDDGMAEEPICLSCGQQLSGGESILDMGSPRVTIVVGSRSPSQMRDDLALFDGSVCFACWAIFCARCINAQAERIDQCPYCRGATKPAYRKHLRELIPLLRRGE